MFSGTNEIILAPGKTIDRIVLFIDDLDRCKPDKVVDVLQAVHLLLAFPLFAVAVGVDQRCLKQSIASEFLGLVEAEDGIKDNKTNEPKPGSEEESATPLDYLEKIFHIPFHLPPMETAGYGRLIMSLTARKGNSVPEPVPGPLPPEGQNARAGALRVYLTEQGPILRRDPEQQERTEGTALVGSSPLEEWERRALTEYGSLIPTPRAAIRFLNTYRLVRGGIPEGDWGTFVGNGPYGEFRIAMLFLAAAAGYPAQARSWLNRLRSVSPQKLFDDYPLQVNSGIRRFKELFELTIPPAERVRDHDLFVKWIAIVERFIF